MLAVLIGAWWSSSIPVTAHAGDVVAGKKKAKACSACHGMDGLSRRPDAPNIAGQVEMYMREQLEKYRSGERANPVMSIVARELSDDDIEDLVVYYSSMTVTVELPR